METTDFSTIVIIADNVPIDKSKLTIYSREIDRAYQTNVAHLKNGFEEFFDSVIVYDDPQDFMANAKSHKNDIIFPYWHGELSRNKHALIASVCEIEQLIYIGPDTYTNIVCSDKIISKDICRIAGVKYPNFIISQEQNIPIKWNGAFPVVAKPVYEGSSLGITKDNLIDNNIDLQNIVDRLWNEFQQPILIEEFIGGTEVNLAIVGWKDNIKAWGATERYHVNDDNYFDHGLFTFEEKNLKDDILLRDGLHLIDDRILAKIKILFAWLDKIEHIRIDGKIFNGEFYCIELTQDADLHPEGSFFSALKYAGYSFTDALRLLVDNCLERYNNLSPNRS